MKHIMGIGVAICAIFSAWACTAFIRWDINWLSLVPTFDYDTRGIIAASTILLALAGWIAGALAYIDFFDHMTKIRRDY